MVVLVRRGFVFAVHLLRGDYLSLCTLDDAPVKFASLALGLYFINTEARLAKDTAQIVGEACGACLYVVVATAYSYG